MEYTVDSLNNLPDRELDAIAHAVVFGKRVIDTRKEERSEALMSYYEDDVADVPIYSTSLDAAARLEERLAYKGLDNRRAETLSDLIDGEPIAWPDLRDDFAKVDYAALARNQRASAKARTIAAIIAMQSAAQSDVK